jgi:uncharacterized membrane protein
MSVFIIIRMIAVVFVGLLAGIYLADRASAPARMKLDSSSFILYQQTVHKVYVRMMPPLVIMAILAALGWIFSVGLQWQSFEFWLLAVAICSIIFVAVITRAVSVPLNQKLMTWNAATPPADMRDQWKRWESVDSIRTIVTLSAFVIEILALCLEI